MTLAPFRARTWLKKWLEVTVITRHSRGQAALVCFGACWPPQSFLSGCLRRPRLLSLLRANASPPPHRNLFCIPFARWTVEEYDKIIDAELLVDAGMQGF